MIIQFNRNTLKIVFEICKVRGSKNYILILHQVFHEKITLMVHDNFSMWVESAEGT